MAEFELNSSAINLFGRVPLEFELPVLGDSDDVWDEDGLDNWDGEDEFLVGSGGFGEFV